MRLKVRLSDLALSTSFLILVPLLFVYFALKDFGLASGLGGYFGFAISVSFLLLFPRMLSHILVRPFLNIRDIAFILLIFLLSYIILFTEPISSQFDVRRGYLSAGIAWVTLYLFASNIGDSRIVRELSLISFLISSGIVLFFSIETLSFSLGTTQQFYTETQNPTYQFFAVFYIIGVAAVVALSSTRVAEIALLFSLPVLLLIGSRTDFVVLFAAYVIMKCLSGLNLTSISSLIIVTLVLFASLSWVASSEYNRLNIFLTDGGNDSQLVRMQTINNGIDTILDNPFLGSAGSYESGFYAHSVLSVWVDFGFVGFLIYVIVFIIFLVKAFRLRKIKSAPGVKIGAFSFALLIAILPAMLFLKSGTYYLLPFAYGLVSHVEKISRLKRAQAPMSAKPDFTVMEDG